MKNFIRMACLFLLVLLTGLQVNSIMAAEHAEDSYLAAPEYLHVYRNSETSLKLIWKKVKHADGYAIYRYDSELRKYRKIKTRKGNKKHQIIDSGLKTNKVYRYKVRAYRNRNGKKQYGVSSYYARAKTYQRNSRSINAGKIMVDRKVTLGLTMSKKMETYVKPSKYGTNKKKKALTQKVRWMSSNPAMATVTSDGTITAGTVAGTCNVYAIAHNGNRRRIAVTVKNYAYPKSFDGYSGTEPIVNELLSDYKNEVCNIAYYFTVNRPTESITIRLDKNGDIICSPDTVNLEAIQKDLDALFYQFPANLRIEASDYCVEYVMESFAESGRMTCRCCVEYYYGNEYKQFDDIIAEHWRWTMFIPEPYPAGWKRQTKGILS